MKAPETGSVRPSLAGWVGARILRTRVLVRAPIAMYRVRLGWLFGKRLVLVEHTGRVSGERRFVVLEVVERTGTALRVASGFGRRAQWYRNLQADGDVLLSTGRAYRVSARATLLSAESSEAVLMRYARAHPRAWRTLGETIRRAGGSLDDVPIVEFTHRTV